MSTQKKVHSASRSRRETAPHIGTSSPPWLEKIESLRGGLGLDQAEFAERLGMTPAAVSFWGRGNKEPSAKTYLLLGNLAEYPDCLWFWQRAGLDPARLARITPSLEKRLKAITAPTGDVIRLPLLRDVTHSGAPALAPPEEIEMWVPVPTWLVSNPATTYCLRPPTEETSTLNLFLVDAIETKIDKLWAKMVVASYTGKTSKRGKLQPGTYSGWLHPFEIENRLIPVLAPRRTPEQIAEMDRYDIHLPNATRDRKPKEVIMSGLDAGFLLGNFKAMTPEGEWHVLGRVVGQIIGDLER